MNSWNRTDLGALNHLILVMVAMIKPILTTSISDTQLVTALDKPRSERTDGHDKSQVWEFRNTATSYLAFNLYATWLIFKNPVKKGKASHRYNRNTRLIEGNED